MDVLKPYREILDHINEGVYYVDRDRRITYWNEAAEIITGYKSYEVLGHFCHNNILQHVDDFGNQLCVSGCPLHATINDGTNRDASVYLHHKLGFRIPVFVRCLPLRDDEGNIQGAIEIFSNHSEHESVMKKIEALEKMAMLDPLTKIPNRRFIDNHLLMKLNEYNFTGNKFGVSFIDLDNFKKINDTYGHETGDQILTMVASTLKNNLRIDDMVGRYGGEEFIVVFSVSESNQTKDLGEKMRMLIEMSMIQKDDIRINVTASVGITVIMPEDDQESILKRADDLMYMSKQNGKNKVSFG